MARAVAKRVPEKTRAALVAAAWQEFEDAGFDGTNTNRIAIRAGFAPQTFYRHFVDKTAIFVAVYAQWVEDELGEIENATVAAKGAAVLIRHHRRSKNFRRALRQLSVSDPAVRAVRAASRRMQIAVLRRRFDGMRSVDEATSATRLLMIERIADACAEGEFGDLGLSAAEAERQLAQLLRELLGIA